MSLRSRLLIAIGVIALVALAIADVATYKSLQSFLYQQVDQQLDHGGHVTATETLPAWRPGPLLVVPPAGFTPLGRQRHRDPATGEARARVDPDWPTPSRCRPSRC